MSTDVMTNPKTTTKEKKRISTKIIAQIGVLGAIAMVLMLFDIPLPFAPTFYKIDFSEVPVLIGAFTMGPVAGALIELVKILLNLLIRGTSTAGVGDLGNFLIGCAMCIPASLIYQKLHSRKGAMTFVLLSVAPFNLLKGFLVSLIVFLIYKKISPILQMGRE